MESVRQKLKCDALKSQKCKLTKVVTRDVQDKDWTLLELYGLIKYYDTKLLTRDTKLIVFLHTIVCLCVCVYISIIFKYVSIVFENMIVSNNCIPRAHRSLQYQRPYLKRHLMCLPFHLFIYLFFIALLSIECVSRLFPISNFAS